MTAFSLLVVLAFAGALGGVLIYLIKVFMKLSELSTTLNAASDTLDAILLRLPVAGTDPELGADNDAAVTRLNASVAALNAAVPTPPVV